MGVKNLIFGQ